MQWGSFVNVGDPSVSIDFRQLEGAIVIPANGNLTLFTAKCATPMPVGPVATIKLIFYKYANPPLQLITLTITGSGVSTDSAPGPIPVFEFDAIFVVVEGFNDSSGTTDIINNPVTVSVQLS